MPGPLTGMTVIEVSAFIAAPYAGLTLAQMGAEVIRIDPIGGGLEPTTQYRFAGQSVIRQASGPKYPNHASLQSNSSRRSTAF